MARQRIGVVLLVPQPLATQIDGLRRALGDGALPRIEPHITLVPPVNVAERDLAQVFAVVRAAASATPSLRLKLGPVASFTPVSPVAYLQVGGPPAELKSLDRLRSACRREPLDRATEHAFVPHVTVAETLAADRLAAATDALTDFSAEVAFDRVHVLTELPGRVWRPVADAPLGEAPAAAGRGSLPLELVISGRPDAEAAALLSLEETSGVPFAITARREGQVVAAAWGWSARRVFELADLVVAAQHRGQGIGRHVLAAAEALARRRVCTSVGTTAPIDGASGALLSAAGFAVSARSDQDRSDGPAASRWERALEPAVTEDVR